MLMMLANASLTSWRSVRRATYEPLELIKWLIPLLSESLSGEALTAVLCVFRSTMPRNQSSLWILAKIF